MTLTNQPSVIALVTILVAALAACGGDTGTSPLERSSAMTVDAEPSLDRDRDDDRERERVRVFSVTGALSDGGSFRGKLRLHGFSGEGGELVAHGDLSGWATTSRGQRARVQKALMQPVQIGTAARVSPRSFELSPAQVQPCSVLTIGFGVISIQVLQNTLDLTLSLISIDLTSSGVLGSLLCGLVQLRL
jgi:hypothetical protein